MSVETKNRSIKSTTEDTVVNSVDDNDDDEVTNNVLVDSRWGCIVIFASFVCGMIIDGICLSFGILLSSLMEEFGRDERIVTWIGSLCTGCYLFIGPFAALLGQTYGCRKVGVAGGTIAVISLFVSSFPHRNIVIVIICYGIFTGFGFGLVYLPSIVVIGDWFEKRRTIATGVVVAGSGLGSILAPPAISYIIKATGNQWQYIALSMAMIASVLCVMSCLLVEKPQQNCLSPDLSTWMMFITIFGPSTKNKGIFVEQDENNLHANISNDQPSTSNSPDSIFAASPMPQFFTDTFFVDLPPYSGTNGPPLYFEESEIWFPKQTQKDSTKTTYDATPCKNTPLCDKSKTRNYSKCNKVSGNSEILQIKAKIDSNVNFADAFKNTGSNKSSGKKRHSSTASEFALEKIRRCSHYTRLIRHNAEENLVSNKSVQLMSRPSFNLLLFSSALAMAGNYIPWFFLPLYSGYGKNILMLLASFNLSGRMLFGYLPDLFALDPLLLNNITLVITGILTCILPLVKDTHSFFFYIYAASFGFFSAAFITLRVTINVDLFTKRHLNCAYGLQCMVEGVVVMLSSPLIAGTCKDVSNDYSYAFFIGGACISLSGLMCIPLRQLARREDMRHKTKAENQKLDSSFSMIPLETEL